VVFNRMFLPIWHVIHKLVNLQVDLWGNALLSDEGIFVCFTFQFAWLR
jgi:hypothetical protein